MSRYPVTRNGSLFTGGDMNTHLTIEEVLEGSRKHKELLEQDHHSKNEIDCYETAKGLMPSGTPWNLILKRAQDLKKERNGNG